MNWQMAEKWKNIGNSKNISTLMPIRIFFLTTFLFLFCNKIKSQNHFGKSYIMSNSVSALWFGDGFYVPQREISYQFKAAISIAPWLYAGVSYHHIFHRNGFLQKQQYSLPGGFIRWQIFPKNTYQFFADIHYAQGDYCACDDALQYYRQKNLFYLGLSFGSFIPIKKSRFALSPAFSFNSIRPNQLFAKSKGNFNLYHIGISYFFGKKN